VPARLKTLFVLVVIAFGADILAAHNAPRSREVSE